MTNNTPAALRAARLSSTLRDRDLAAELGVTEAALLAAQTGADVVRIDSGVDRLIPAVQELGEVMALTRNDSTVHERVGRYLDFRPGNHAAGVFGPEIDLRLFPAHWCHAFAVTRQTERGTTRSVQVFDAAGDAVHKVHLREGSDVGAFQRLIDTLRLDLQDDGFAADPRKPAEELRTNPEKLDELREAWRRMTDTHQFMRLTGRLGMNRLGAYRGVGAPFVRALDPRLSGDLLRRLAETGQEVILFVGNRGCIQIHWGPVERIVPSGPWINVLDPRFNLHLRADRVAEVWAVEKPTRRGPALSVEAFDKDGTLLYQIFGKRNETEDHTESWARLVAELPDAAEVPA
ncbi:hemin-degrading factor [Pseudoroseicyclus aestuarii]|uniref:Putative hemin transport protein n=1 Tax=Pseudoroseicyclus aestuarii TaxID=1795041 RepID=A0A318SN72_9RHOB|nr:ChuX/HutX family heme-like substrate-binding protein [Pseudoroseicyclus aestuarii]PYE81312.1 putative hemin transport protein [Pseudoroseicyclus aestuarii]